MSAGASSMVVRRQQVDQLLQSLQLVRDPFPVTPDFETYFFSERLRARYEDLLSAVALRKGFVLVTGDVGVGKTTLARLLINAMQGQGVRTALVINTFVQGQELLRVINRDFGLEARADSIEGLLEELHVFLLEQFAAGSNCVLVIDDAQALAVESLELLRQLSNLETSRHKLLQLVLVGQPELLELLERDDLRQLRSRIAMHLQLEPMTLAEMDAYLFHRLAAAGNGAALKVDADAMELLWRSTSGFPRRVHMVMDRCLFGALGRRLSRIDLHLMREAIAEVEIPAAGSRARAVAPAAMPARRPFKAIAVVLLLAALVAAARLEVLPLPAAGQNWAAVQSFLGRSGVAAPPPAAAGPSAVPAHEPVPEADSKAARPADGLRDEVGETGLRASEAGVADAALTGTPATESLFAAIPVPLWQAFWLRQGVDDMPAPAQLPADTLAALGRLNALLEARGLLAVLLSGAQKPCEEHLALRVSDRETQAESVLAVAGLPRQAGPIEFGKTSPTVRWLQQRLRAHGLLGSVHEDALLGPVTVQALAQFQRGSGLTATGQPDELSLYRLSCASRRGTQGRTQPAQVQP